MSTSRPFAYNPTHLTLAGTENVGDICIGVSPTNNYNNYGGLTWWNGPNEDLGYVIAVPVPSNTQPTPYPGVFASVGFWGTEIYSNPLTEGTFVNLVNNTFSQTFTTGYDASTWLFTNGYWTNYLPISNADAYNYGLQVVSAGGFIDFTTATALDLLFNDLQGYSLYSQLEGFYPMLGETSATQSINGNLNTAYDLTLYGGWTFDSMGMKGNGINTFADTGKEYGVVTNEELWNTHFSIYGTLVSNTPSNHADLSTFNNVDDPSVTIALNKYLLGNGVYEYTFGSASPTIGNSGDFVTISNDGNTTYSYQNGTSGGGVSSIPYCYSYETLMLGVSTPNGYGYPTISTNRYGWASFGGFMSSTDMGYYQTIVNTFMTSIGRNTY